MNRFRLKLYEMYAKFHLRYSCPRCPRKRRLQRDIAHEGECFWYTNWKAGRYNTRTYQTYSLFKRFGIDKDVFLK